MKHVFLIQSHLTYYLSKSIVEQLRLDEKNVYFLTIRDYKNNNLISNHTSVDSLFEAGLGITSKNFYKYYKNIKDIDSLLMALFFKEEFAVYLPHFAHPLFQVIATNLNCKTVSFFEEGTSCYSQKSFSNVNVPLIKRFVGCFLNKLNIYGRGRYFHVNYQYSVEKVKSKIGVFYALSKRAFSPFEEKREILNLYAENCDYSLNKSSLLLLEAGVESGYITKSVFLDIIKEKAMTDFRDRVISLKFHPVQNVENRQEILSILKNAGIVVHVISDSVPIEQLLIKYKKLEVFGFASSLLLYANLFGHTVISYDKELYGRDSVYRKFREFFDFELEG